MSDLDLVRRAAEDPDIVAVSSVPHDDSDDAGRAFIERQHRRAELGDGYSFVIASATGPERGIGSIGLWLDEIESGRASVGYWILPAARGHGLAGWALARRGVLRLRRTRRPAPPSVRRAVERGVGPDGRGGGIPA